MKLSTKLNDELDECTIAVMNDAEKNDFLVIRKLLKK